MWEEENEGVLHLYEKASLRFRTHIIKDIICKERRFRVSLEDGITSDTDDTALGSSEKGNNFYYF